MLGADPCLVGQDEKRAASEEEEEGDYEVYSIMFCITEGAEQGYLICDGQSSWEYRADGKRCRGKVGCLLAGPSLSRRIVGDGQGCLAAATLVALPSAAASMPPPHAWGCRAPLFCVCSRGNRTHCAANGEVAPRK